MSPSTAGARHLAVSAIWLAAQKRLREKVAGARLGTLADIALSHMDEDALEEFCRWCARLKEAA